MKLAIVLLFALSSILGIFCCWGLFTPEGHRSYDEMDGMIPFFAGCGAVACIIVGFLLLALYAYRCNHKKRA